MSEENIFEQFVEEVSQDSLEKLQSYCKEYKELEKEIEYFETTLKDKKAILEDISRIKIPTLLNSYSLSEIKLSSGEKVIIKDKVNPNIKKENLMLAYRNMVSMEKEEGGENAEEKINSLFKDQLIIANFTEDQLDLLLDNDIPYETKKEIHYQTLKSYCSGKLKQGKKIPEGITVFEYQETTIKKD